jgi:hypothetical protein
MLPQNSPQKLLEEEQVGGNLTMVSDGGGVVGIWPVTRRNDSGQAELNGGVLQTWRKQVNSGNDCGTERQDYYTLL